MCFGLKTVAERNNPTNKKRTSLRGSPFLFDEIFVITALSLLYSAFYIVIVSEYIECGNLILFVIVILRSETTKNLEKGGCFTTNKAKKINNTIDNHRKI